MSDIIYLCGSTNMILAWVSSRCVIKWKELRGSPADFSQRLQGIRQGVSTTALLWSFMLWPNEWKRWGFQGRKYLQFRAVNEYIITARASCTVSFSLPSNRFCAVREQITENPVLRSLLHGNACYAGYRVLWSQPRSQGLSSYRPLERAVRWETLGTRLLWPLAFS